MEIYNKAHELARAIKECEEQKNLHEITKKLDSDEVTKKMVQEFMTKQMEFEYTKMLGNEVSEEDLKKHQELSVLVNNNSLAKEYLQTYYRWQQLAGDIYKIVGDAMSEGMGILDKK